MKKIRYVNANYIVDVGCIQLYYTKYWREIKLDVGNTLAGLLGLAVKEVNEKYPNDMSVPKDCIDTTLENTFIIEDLDSKYQEQYLSSVKDGEYHFNINLIDVLDTEYKSDGYRLFSVLEESLSVYINAIVNNVFENIAFYHGKKVLLSFSILNGNTVIVSFVTVDQSVTT